ncbi:FecR domain-containing protein [Candidatus Ozemobacteraceae bacterium]|nr:FecR domain-containing protein [Candidatus Ozemobacteraceae bacterium]
MKRLLFVVFAFLLSFGAVAMALEDAGVVFSDLAGQVEVRPGDDEEAWEFAKIDRKLYTDDHVKTGLDSSAILSFADMSTFVMKPSTEIILSSPTKKESKIKLAAGNIWVNVKKMVQDGTMEIEMSQAVAGIKGTNITCQTNPDGSEDRIQVLRGLAEILIKETRERVSLKEGEELIVKAGGKTEKIEIDVEKEKEKWKDQLGRLGESIQLNEIPDVLRQMQQSEAERFTAIQDSYKTLIGLESVTEEASQEFFKEVERFIGALMEDGIILASIHLKVTNAMATPDIKAEDRVRLVSYQKMIADVRATMQSYQSEASKMMKTQFKTAAVSLEEELSPVRDSAQAVFETVDSIMRELEGNPVQGQDWFQASIDTCTDALAQLEPLAEEVSTLLEKSPTDTGAQALLKLIADYQTKISNMLRDLAVVPVDPSMLTEMQQLEDLVSAAIFALQERIAAYNSISGTSVDVQKRQLEESLRILNEFSIARRKYISAQRMYDSTMRAASSQKYRTSEQEELSAMYDRISDSFGQLGAVADVLESELNDLENQLNTILNQ